MSKSSKELEQQARRAEYPAIKPLKLAMGEPDRCFSNHDACCLSTS